jgi:flagellar biosynthesis protein FliP
LATLAAQERARLLHAVQRSLNSGATSGTVVFVSGFVISTINHSKWIGFRLFLPLLI